MRASLAPLRAREFRLLFLGRTISFAGTAIAPIALAFAVLDLTDSLASVGLVLAARTIPQIVFLLLGGVWADRLPQLGSPRQEQQRGDALRGGVRDVRTDHDVVPWQPVRPHAAE
ncbi:MAG TPA: MFS transporter, partial [Gaiellaceae bacterium]|nr:MFS transporter [Gaiellaceae bacterium]